MNTFKEYYEENWKFDGQSAKSIYGVHIENYQGDNHPCDPDDLTRCFQCLRMITRTETSTKWIEIIEKVVLKYPDSKWKIILNNFNMLYYNYFAEYDTDKMTKTYNFMKLIGL